MKNLLLSFLTLFSGTILSTMPKQSIFSANCAYECMKIDTDKLTIAEAILSPKCESRILIDRKKSFYNDLTKLYGNDSLTRESLLATVERYQEIYDHQAINTCSINEMHIGELLKEQKNNLIRKNLRLVIFYPQATIGDTPAQDYSVFALYSAILSAGLYNESTHAFYITAALSLGFTAKLYSLYRTVRNNEAEMNKIDAMISAIEAIEHAETQ